MKPYYQDNLITLYNCDCLEGLRELPDESVDLLCTDPPYGISFMGKDWDRALPDKNIWRECLRVLKSGSFAFVMSIPRADCLSRMIISLEDAGFEVNFTPIFWVYASGFPKAQNISKAVDKRLGAEREVIGIKDDRNRNVAKDKLTMTATLGMGTRYNDIPSTPQAKALDGSYGGFQPKPAVEIVIVAMKPLSEKTFVDQALKNRKGITWLDDGRIPYESEADKESARFGVQVDITGGNYGATQSLKKPQAVIGRNKLSSQSGRFPANLIVSDDVLNTGEIIKAAPGGMTRFGGMFGNNGDVKSNAIYTDSGSFSRYFDLDKWFTERIKELPKSVQKTFPFLIVPKASKSEKNRYLDIKKTPYEETRKNGGKSVLHNNPNGSVKVYRNSHPTVKPLKLMSYLITLGSREGDIVLDPFIGSGTTAFACKLTGRKCIGIELDKRYCPIIIGRNRQLAFG